MSAAQAAALELSAVNTAGNETWTTTLGKPSQPRKQEREKFAFRATVVLPVNTGQVFPKLHKIHQREPLPEATGGFPGIDERVKLPEGCVFHPDDKTWRSLPDAIHEFAVLEKAAIYNCLGLAAYGLPLTTSALAEIMSKKMNVVPEPFD